MIRLSVRKTFTAKKARWGEKEQGKEDGGGGLLVKFFKLDCLKVGRR